ncbi:MULTISPECIES: zf-HC2 domain-containing protein [Pseudomonas]|uniref:Zf-HC2 domain-containing protein n=1 Tax=Pseudomonas donghuensis TaxID=1163398 RepID=A0AAP0XBT2_9PSED|nr:MULTISPECIES: zf-HC2 domain-containing protein [Pseudomonas]MCE6983028.1 anti-sigma factor [Pseudomonas frederiksbergensis]MDF9892306.1 anti-sigma factor RsiW [Pseudomonas vranovensis]KDO01771.1 zf-HC2 domain-containing protein [Pseudomonas donghuensis]MBF4208119.1 anti-sigma factor [Pseudomonas donghuensis]MBS7599968.1 zf-HC2 domain-containing protein [Pseudomonas sp. RC2C2]
MLSCKQLVARSSDYLDEQLTLGERLMVRQHLLFCRHCRRFLKQMRVAQATVRALPEAPVVDSDALAERLARELKNS